VNHDKIVESLKNLDSSYAVPSTNAILHKINESH